jgi:hypothetical protein
MRLKIDLTKSYVVKLRNDLPEKPGEQQQPLLKQVPPLKQPPLGSALFGQSGSNDGVSDGSLKLQFGPYQNGLHILSPIGLQVQ